MEGAGTGPTAPEDGRTDTVGREGQEGRGEAMVMVAAGTGTGAGAERYPSILPMSMSETFINYYIS